MKYRGVWKLNYCTGVPGEVLAVGAAGASVRRSWGCPMPDMVSSSWFQPVPTTLPQGTAKPLSQAGGISGKACLRKGKKHQTGRGRERKSEKHPCKHQGQRRRRGRRCFRQSRDSPTAHREPMPEQISTPQPVKNPTPEQVDTS